MLRGVFKGLLVLVLVVLILALLATLKIVFYTQEDDPELLTGKSRYLESLARISADSGGARPNIVFVLYDDLGYGDLGITGSDAIRTPNIDQLARAGVRMNNFYASAPVCTPSRYGFLTGRFAERGQLSHVVFPRLHPITQIHKLFGANIRIPAHEITLPEVLGAVGYTTGMVGKWHLGDHAPSLPNDMGFDEFFGALYSNDMQPFALYRNREIVHDAPFDQTRLTARYAEEASEFIARNENHPFFLYVAHNFPHVPLYADEQRLGKSRGGLYGDVVEGLDQGLEKILESLKQAGVYDNTLVIVSSDNGPWFQGDPGMSRGRKGETFEGGMHVPFIAHWPEVIEGGRVLDGLAMGTDLMPTVLDLLGLPAPADRVLDGETLLAMLKGERAEVHEYLYYFSGELMAVRDHRFKYMPRRSLIYPTAKGRGISFSKGPWLFDLEVDGRESYDVSAHAPEAAKQLREIYLRKSAAMRNNSLGKR